jgi:hypothetical protein
MSRRTKRATGEVSGRGSRSGPLAVLALVLVAGACGGSSTHAASQPAPKATTAPTVRATTTTTTTQPGSIKLVSENGVTPAELHRAETLVASTIKDLKRFQTPAMAYAAGYRSIGDSITGDEHYTNWSYVNDGHILDPTRPESVVYEVRNGKQTAVAAMYSLPLGSSFAEVPDVGGALTQWHVHDNLCLTDNPQQRLVAGITSAKGGCPPGTSKAGNTPMMHVWTVPNPCGPFAALEGIGAGQVPAGQTRNCDTRNASVR